MCARRGATSAWDSQPDARAGGGHIWSRPGMYSSKWEEGFSSCAAQCTTWGCTPLTSITRSVNCSRQRTCQSLNKRHRLPLLLLCCCVPPPPPCPQGPTPCQGVVHSQEPQVAKRPCSQQQSLCTLGVCQRPQMCDPVCCSTDGTEQCL